MKRRAFTLIEILVVLGIIAALAAMLFLGFGYVSKSTRGNATNATLQTLKGMMTEYETSGGSMDRLENLYDTAAPHPAPDFPPTPPEFPASFQIAAPTNAIFESDLGQPLSEQKIIRKTRMLMNRLLAVPSNQKVLDSLPPSIVSRSGDGVVLLDAHKNPIIYVPSRGITGVDLGKDTSAAGYTSPNQTITNPDRRHGFWLSAGEDGSFKKGDDNESSVGR